MRKFFTLAGPAAALIALKCPICLLALAGLSAGVGSMVPVIHWSYRILILALGGAFLWYLHKNWRQGRLPSWPLGIGALGLVTLAIQTFVELDGLFAFVPVATLSIASIGALIEKGKRSQTVVCSTCVTDQSPQNIFGEKKDLHLTLGVGLKMGSKEDNMAKRKIEVFTSGCPVCEPVVDLVKKTACSSCDVVVYDLNAGCSTNECRDKAKQYGITRVPAVVVDGKFLDCCRTGTVSEQELRAAGVGSA